MLNLPDNCRERASGMYRLSAFFFARMASDLPMDFAGKYVSSVVLHEHFAHPPGALGVFHTFMISFTATVHSCSCKLQTTCAAWPDRRSCVVMCKAKRDG